MPDRMLGAGVIAVNKKDKIPTLKKQTISKPNDHRDQLFTMKK